MENIERQRLGDGEIIALSVLALAHIGDGIYELLTRTELVRQGDKAVAALHRDTVKRVRAEAQASAAERILDRLTPEELAVYKRGRNARVNSVPKAASVSQYHAATALEALFGYLYLKGRDGRIEELFAAITEGYHAS